MPPRRCSPKGSSEAAFCGVLQSRRGDASRWARLRRLPTGFSNGGAARSAAVPFCPSFPRRPAALLSLPAARHFSCILLSRRAAGTAPLSLPPARAAEQRAPFSPYRRRARHCTSFSAPRRPPPDAAHGRPIHPDRQDNPSSLSHASGRRARPCEPAGSPFYFHSFPRASRASGRRPRTAHPPVPARGCSCSRLLPPHLSFDFRPALPSAPPTPVRASLPRRFLRFRAALFPAAARCIRPCSCAGGRIAPFFRLFPRAPRAFPSQRSLRAGLCIASRWRKL